MLSLVAYAVSFLVCYLLSFRSKQRFDFSTIKDMTGDFDPEAPRSPRAADAADAADGSDAATVRARD